MDCCYHRYCNTADRSFSSSCWRVAYGRKPDPFRVLFRIHNPPPIRPLPAPGLPSRTPLSGNYVQKPPIFEQRISGNLQYQKIYANRSVSHGAEKTITGNNQWRNSGKSRVQHVGSKGRAVFSFQITAHQVPFFIKWYPLLLELPGGSRIGNRSAICRSKSVSDFRIAIAIAIPIKNRSGKIEDRFSC